MLTLMRLILAVAVTATAATALSPTDSARIARVFPFEVGQQYQFKSGGDYHRPNGEVLPVGQVAEITITDTTFAGRTWLHIPYWSPFGSEFYYLDEETNVMELSSVPDFPFRLLKIVDGDYPYGAEFGSINYWGYWYTGNQITCQPMNCTGRGGGWIAFEPDSSYLINFNTPHGTGAGALHGAYAPGSCLHAWMAKAVYEGEEFVSIQPALLYGLFRPKSDDPWPEFDTPVGIEQGDAPEWPAHAEVALLESYPNPFNPSTTIRYAIELPGLVKISVFDVAGRDVRTLVSRHHQSTGTHTVTWDGTDDSGRAAASGVYIVRLEHTTVGRSGGVRTANSQTNSNEVRVRRVTLVR